MDKTYILETDLFAIIEGDPDNLAAEVRNFFDQYETIDSEDGFKVVVSKKREQGD